MGERLAPRRVLEDLWKARTRIAYGRYKTAREAARAAEEFRIDTPDPDETFALHRARQAENAALDEYRRVLTILSDLVAYGKIPVEEA